MAYREFIQMECSSCKEEINADKNADYWYCGYCGKRIDLKATAELKELENKLLAKESELRIKEMALKKREAEVKAKEDIISAVEAGEIPVIQEAPTGPTFKASVQPNANGEVPTLNRPDTILNNPEMKFNNLSSVKEDVKTAESEPAKAVVPEPAKPVQTVQQVQEAKSEQPVPVAEEKTEEQETVQTETPVAEPVKTEETEAEFGEKGNNKKEFQMKDHTLVRYNGTIAKVYIPGNVWRIGEGAFKNNSTLVSVVCGDQVKEICKKAFMNCTELTEINLPPEMRKINYKTFEGCTKLKSITIPKSVELIEGEAMMCGLEEVIFENSETRWELNTDFAEASFRVDKSTGKGIKTFKLNGVDYNAAEIFRFKSLSEYFKSKGLCRHCGSEFNFMKKCKVCEMKKDY